MEISNKSFDEDLKEFRLRLKSADLVALDFEFTGLYEPYENTRMCYWDVPEERYAKMRRAIKSFSPSQLGLCLLKWNGKDSVYEYKPFSIHLLQRQSSIFKFREKPFLSSPSALEFLANNGFDFNKWIREGLSYIKRSQEKEIMARYMKGLIESADYIDLESEESLICGVEKIVNWMVDKSENTALICMDSKICARNMCLVINKK